MLRSKWPAHRQRRYIIIIYLLFVRIPWTINWKTSAKHVSTSLWVIRHTHNRTNPTDRITSLTSETTKETKRKHKTVGREKS